MIEEHGMQRLDAIIALPGGRSEYIVDSPGYRTAQQKNEMKYIIYPASLSAKEELGAENAANVI